jgi:hypothetical protein
VGRDVLVGGLCGVLFAVNGALGQLVPLWLGLAPEAPERLDPFTLTHPVSVLLEDQMVALEFGFRWFALLFFLSLLLRRVWVGVAVTCVCLLAFYAPWQYVHPAVYAVQLSASIALGIWVMLRFGLLSVVVAYYFFSVVIDGPLSLDVGAWYAGVGGLYAAVLLALAGAAFYVSLGGRPLYGPGFFGED